MADFRDLLEEYHANSYIPRLEEIDSDDSSEPPKPSPTHVYDEMDLLFDRSDAMAARSPPVASARPEVASRSATGNRQLPEGGCDETLSDMSD
jgi:hypothetical protein